MNETFKFWWQMDNNWIFSDFTIKIFILCSYWSWNSENQQMNVYKHLHHHWNLFWYFEHTYFISIQFACAHQHLHQLQVHRLNQSRYWCFILYIITIKLDSHKHVSLRVSGKNYNSGPKVHSKIGDIRIYWASENCSKSTAKGLRSNFRADKLCFQMRNRKNRNCIQKMWQVQAKRLRSKAFRRYVGCQREPKGKITNYSK